jgi:valyl-tRNA synthetase
VNVHERCGTEIEFSVAAQWFIRVLDMKDEIVDAGSKVVWCPEFMHTRFRNWVENLKWDWCVSRQRYYGVPFPVWYPLDDAGEPLHDRPIVPDEDALPVDPSSDVPPGYTDEQRGAPGGFVGDPDIMDTWATSSLTPQIAGGGGGPLFGGCS